MAMDFHEVSFPLALSMQARGGPQRRTDILTTGAGFESRISRWAASRRRYEIGSGLKTRNDLAVLMGFFEERRGPLYGFRFRDPLDHASAACDALVTPFDQVIGQGDGARMSFQLLKTYGGAFAPYQRVIAKPVAGTVRLAVAGVEVMMGTDADCDVTTGAVVFRTGRCPTPGQVIMDDHLEAALDAYGCGEMAKITLIEILCQTKGG
jgi:uncharacterized protein (TIGR02217 family)